MKTTVVDFLLPFLFVIFLTTGFSQTQTFSYKKYITGDPVTHLPISWFKAVEGMHKDDPGMLPRSDWCCDVCRVGLFTSCDCDHITRQRCGYQ